MKVQLNLTGDPWMDWGLAAFAQLCEENVAIFSPEIAQGWIKLKIDAPGEARDLVVTFLKQLLDSTVLLPAEAKLLGYPRTRTAEGYYDIEQRWSLGKEEEDRALESFRNRFAAGKKPSEGKEIKYPAFKPNKKSGVSLKRNYPGLKKDWQKLHQNLEDNIKAFFRQWEQESATDKFCSLCGRATSTQFEMRQNKNPFYNQHHNNKIRGHQSSVTVNSMCPTCNFLNIFAAASADLPYFVEEKTHVLVPQVDNLSTLMEIRKLIRNNSLDMDAPMLISYRTNIRGLPYWRPDLYTSLIGVYWNLKHKYMRQPNINQEDWGLGLSLDQQNQVERWIVFRYSKGQNVILTHFNYLRVNNRLFQLLDTVKYGPDEAKEGNLYRDLLRTMPTGKGRAREDFSHGLVMKNWRLVSQAVFSLFKDGENFASALWARFFDYALEVDEVLSEELLEDVKTVGNTLGRAFAKDIGMMSAINNVHDEASLRKVLKDAFMKMHKIVATTTRFGGEEETWVPGSSRVENILSSVTRENVAAIRDTMLIYSTLAAMNRLQRENKKGGNE
jgi:hypothetical protein